jgi:hypothetical protein
MPYLQVDLDALDDFSAVAIRTGLSEGDVAIGLLRLWRHCWKNKTAYVTRERLGGFFRGDVDATIMALEVCEFVDRPEGRTDIHVRGAEKRLGIEKAQVEAGKQHSGNLKRGQKSPGPSRVPPGSPSGSPPAPPPGPARLLHPASSIQHPKEEEKREAPAAAPPPPDPEALRVLWNDNLPAELPQCLELGKVRTSAARARLREKPDLPYWRDIIQRIRLSDFCRGWNERGWRADFDFLVRPGSAAKVLEGKYDNRDPPLKKAAGMGGSDDDFRRKTEGLQTDENGELIL